MWLPDFTGPVPQSLLIRKIVLSTYQFYMIYFYCQYSPADKFQYSFKYTKKKKNSTPSCRALLWLELEYKYMLIHIGSIKNGARTPLPAMPDYLRYLRATETFEKHIKTISLPLNSFRIVSLIYPFLYLTLPQIDSRYYVMKTEVDVFVPRISSFSFLKFMVIILHRVSQKVTLFVTKVSHYLNLLQE